MTNLVHADIFFFISSIGFIVLTVLFIIALIYFILVMRRFLRITKMIEEGLFTIRHEAEKFFEKLHESRLFSWIIRKKKEKRKE